MSCAGCNRLETDQVVKLIDGTTVCTYCPSWARECEARHILSIPDKVARREYLRGREEAGKIVKRGILQVRGEKACQELEALVRRVWEHGRR
jgi:hypothetical protein